MSFGAASSSLQKDSTFAVRTKERSMRTNGPNRSLNFPCGSEWVSWSVQSPTFSFLIFPTYGSIIMSWSAEGCGVLMVMMLMLLLLRLVIKFLSTYKEQRTRTCPWCGRWPKSGFLWRKNEKFGIKFQSDFVPFLIKHRKFFGTE